MTNILVSFLGTDVLWSTDTYRITEVSLTWPQSRYLIGWNPWMGFGKGSVFEGHLILLHESMTDGKVQLFMRGPHKEAPSVMYDEASNADFFPAGYGRFVPAGEKITLQFLISNTYSVANPAGGQANARIFSVLA